MGVRRLKIARLNVCSHCGRVAFLARHWRCLCPSGGVEMGSVDPWGKPVEYQRGSLCCLWTDRIIYTMASFIKTKLSMNCLCNIHDDADIVILWHHRFYKPTFIDCFFIVAGFSHWPKECQGSLQNGQGNILNSLCLPFYTCHAG